MGVQEMVRERIFFFFFLSNMLLEENEQKNKRRSDGVGKVPFGKAIVITDLSENHQWMLGRWVSKGEGQRHSDMALKHLPTTRS